MEDSLTPLYILVGTTVVGQVAAGIVTFVKFLGNRAIKQEEEKQQSVTKRLDEMDERFEALESSLLDLDKRVGKVNTSVEGVVEVANRLHGSVGEITKALDTRFEKQAEFYRSAAKETVATFTEKLAATEYTIRQDMTRSIHDSTKLASKRWWQP